MQKTTAGRDSSVDEAGIFSSEAARKLMEEVAAMPPQGLETKVLPQHFSPLAIAFFTVIGAAVVAVSSP